MRWALAFVFAACGRIDFEPAERIVCPDTYQAVIGVTSKYRLLSDSSSWVAGENACQADGAHLVVFDNEAEETSVLPLIPSAGGGVSNANADEAWVGISDLATEGVFLTVYDEEARFLPWDATEPNDAGGEDCVQVLSSGAFNDLACDVALRVMCECTPN